MRFSPRGNVTVENVSGYGQYKGSIGTDPNKACKNDAAFKAAVEKLGSSAQGIAAHPHPGLKCKFKLDVAEAWCSGSGPERLCEAFIENFADDIDKHCKIAMRIANSGAAGAAARDCMGKSPGNPVHIVMPQTDGIGNITDMGTDGHPPKQAGPTLHLPL